MGLVRPQIGTPLAHKKTDYKRVNSTNLTSGALVASVPVTRKWSGDLSEALLSASNIELLTNNKI